jgi:hypothetical protein
MHFSERCRTTSRSSTVRFSDIADILGVTHQRTSVIVGQRGSPNRSAAKVRAASGIAARSRRGRGSGGAKALALAGRNALVHGRLAGTAGDGTASVGCATSRTPDASWCPSKDEAPPNQPASTPPTVAATPAAEVPRNVDGGARTVRDRSKLPSSRAAVASRSPAVPPTKPLRM